MILWVLIATVLGAILYRLGGHGKPFNTKFRDLGLPLVAFLLLWKLGVGIEHWWQHLIHFGLFFGALTTYLDSIFGYDNFYAHGFLCALAAGVFFWAGIPWWLIAIRVAVCAIGCGLWSKWIGHHIVEECGRGAILIGSIAILTI